jgi:hypothetical protein
VLIGQGLYNNKKGFGMVDTVMALCMLMLGVLALLATMPVGWSSAGNSDNRGRAAEILRAELEHTQSLVMNPCNLVVANAFPPKTVYSTGNAAVIPNSGDFPYIVTKTIALVPPNATVWRISVTVTWPGTTTGVSTSRIVMKQEDYRYSGSTNPANSCADNSVTTISWN